MATAPIIDANGRLHDPHTGRFIKMAGAIAKARKAAGGGGKSGGGRGSLSTVAGKVAAARTPKAPSVPKAPAQPTAPNHTAIKAAHDVAYGRTKGAHTVGVQISTYRSLKKADFDTMDPALRSNILSDLRLIQMHTRGRNHDTASKLLHRFTPPGTPVGVVPPQPIVPPPAFAKDTISKLTGQPGLLKLAKDPGSSGDGWFQFGSASRVWGKYGAAGILLHHRDSAGVDRFLMVQRGPGISDPGKWQFPGGAIDSKESPFEGATREVVEELGFTEADLAPGRVYGTHEVSLGGGAWKYTSIAATVPKQLKPDLSTHHARMETADAKWMTVDEIRKLDKDHKLLAPLAGGALERNVLSLFPPGTGAAKPGQRGLPTHKPSLGRDLLTDKAAIDKLRQDVKKTRTRYAGKAADDRLAAIAAMQGFDETPTVATKAEIDELLRTGDYIEAWRGVASRGWGKSAADMHEDMRSGPAYFGKGIFGNGYYLATDKQVAEAYADGKPGSLMRVLIPKTAVMEPHSKMIAEARKISSAKSKAKGGGGAEWGTLFDEGRYAAAKGVDGILIDHTARTPSRTGTGSGGSGSTHVAKVGKPAYNWLNRSVLIIQEA